MHVHILGICGTFMAGIARLALSMGHRVTGSDQNVYPPMSDQLREAGVEIYNGYGPEQLQQRPDLVVVGNAMRRGFPVIEALLDQKIPYISGPEWLYEHVLRYKKVLAVAGTHGKTTTCGMLAWILESAGLNPGFLIGGVMGNFGVSARLTDGECFVVEADEYDSAFFDKRAKFVHYRPDIAVLNNLEFDHADIYNSLDEIKKQFHHLIRTIPASGRIICNATEKNLEAVLAMGCWTPVQRFGNENTADLSWKLLREDGSKFCLRTNTAEQTVTWDLLGAHNVQNAAAAVLAAMAAGVNFATAVTALSSYTAPARRLQRRGEVNGATVFDDFAHHPTAIATTLAAVRANLDNKQKLFAVIEFRSYTMRSGVHSAEAFCKAFAQADEVYILRSTAEGQNWLDEWSLQDFSIPIIIVTDIEELIARLLARVHAGDRIIGMSNGSFDGFYDKILKAENKTMM